MDNDLDPFLTLYSTFLHPSDVTSWFFKNEWNGKIKRVFCSPLVLADYLLHGCISDKPEAVLSQACESHLKGFMSELSFRLHSVWATFVSGTLKNWDKYLYFRVTCTAWKIFTQYNGCQWSLNNKYSSMPPTDITGVNYLPMPIRGHLQMAFLDWVFCEGALWLTKSSQIFITYPCLPWLSPTPLILLLVFSLVSKILD